MTYEEAIEVMQLARAEIEWEYPLDYVVALDTSIEALEKQIPKKQIQHDEIGSDSCWFECPNCGEYVSGYYPTEDGYCAVCGQRLE